MCEKPRDIISREVGICSVANNLYLRAKKNLQTNRLKLGINYIVLFENDIPLNVMTDSYQKIF